MTGFLSQAVDPSLSLDYIAPNIIERFIFADGGSMDFSQITQRVLESAKTDGSDPIYGFIDQDTLDGGAGDDLLVGREGGDTYIFGRDYGLDNIEDGDFSVKLFEGVSIPSVSLAAAQQFGFDNSAIQELLASENSSDDILQFQDDLRWTDFDYLREGASDNLTLQISGTTDGVVLTDFLRAEPFLGFINRIEQFVFGDGTVWHFTQLLQHYVDTVRTDGDDIIYGFLTSDTLDGGAGNDRLEGQTGNDTYVVRANDGNDVIFDSGGGSDQVVLEGIALADVDISRTGLDLIFTLRSTGETVTFEGQYLRAQAQGAAIESFVFTDRVVSFTEINPEDIDRIGTNAGEELRGSDFAEIIDGLGGNDTLIGGSDGDTYRFGIGYGEDLIIDRQQAASWVGRQGREIETGDRVLFGADVTRDMLVFSIDGDDLLISIKEHTDSLRIRDQFGDVVNGVEFFDFSDGTTLLISDVEEQLQIVGGNRGDNFIEGTLDQPNVLDGRQGDDTLVGGNEADTYARPFKTVGSRGEFELHLAGQPI